MPIFAVYNHLDETFVESGDTVAIFREGNNNSKIDLYIDGYYIYSHNWKYLSSDRRHLEYSQPPQDHHKMLLSGRLTFKPGYLLGEGTMTFGQSENQVKLASLKSAYMLDTGDFDDDQLAYYSIDRSDVFWLNRNNDYWDNYAWFEGEYKYEYWFEYEDNEMVLKVTYTHYDLWGWQDPAVKTPTTNVPFYSYDEDTGSTHYTVMSADGAINLAWPFPQRFKYEFEDEFAKVMNGGAMQFDYTNEYGTVIAFKGVSVRSQGAVGTYSLQTARKKSGILVIHPKGLTINGKKADGLEITGNKASWKGSAKTGYMSQDGFVEFSECKKKVTCSSGAKGISIA
jgi:hypothetical protein